LASQSAQLMSLQSIEPLRDSAATEVTAGSFHGVRRTFKARGVAGTG